MEGLKYTNQMAFFILDSKTSVKYSRGSGKINFLVSCRPNSGL